MYIREATVKDTKLVLNLLDQFRSEICKLYNSTKDPPFDKSLTIKALNSYIRNPNTTIFIAFNENDNGIGIVTVNRILVFSKSVYKSEIEEFFIKPEFQDFGIGTMLLNEVEEWSKKRDVKYIEVSSGLELIDAHEFYKRRGFKECSKGFEKYL